MTHPAFFSFLLILLSPAIGSFLAVLADRLPRGEDVLRARSKCRGCERRLSAAELVPLLSFVRQRGRCRSCSAAIPPWTLYVELLALGAAVLAVLAGGTPTGIGLAALWLWLMITLGVADLLWFRLPDPLTLGVFVVALTIALMPGGHGVTAAALGATLGAGSFLLLRWGYQHLRGQVGLGLGDIKLMAGLGAFAGPFDLPLLVLMAASVALAAAFVTRDRDVGFDGGKAVPFGAALCVAAAFLWLIRAAQ